MGIEATIVWSSGKDRYLMFKHEETPDGALNAEEVLWRLLATQNTRALSGPNQ